VAALGVPFRVRPVIPGDRSLPDARGRRSRPTTIATSVVAGAVIGILGACTPVEDPRAEMEDASEALRPPRGIYEPDGPERDSILATVQSVFDALETGDGELLRSVIAPWTVMSSVESRDGRSGAVQTTTVDGLVERIESSEIPLIERMWDPVVRVRGPIASVWAPYDFYVGQELSHCGIDAATLLRGESGWTIVGLSWTRDQPPGCPLHPDGPPAG
jgi:hypothetical protein